MIRNWIFAGTAGTRMAQIPLTRSDYCIGENLGTLIRNSVFFIGDGAQVFTKEVPVLVRAISVIRFPALTVAI